MVLTKPFVKILKKIKQAKCYYEILCLESKFSAGQANGRTYRWL